MSILKRTRRPSGFTLVELLIVVIILAILAAIVIPQFSSSSSDAKLAALQSNLSAMRNAIELYRAQHGAYPGGMATTGGSCSATKGTGTGATDPQSFKDHLLMYSDSSGNTCSVGDTTTFKYGPYIRGKIPADPNGVDTVVIGEPGSAGGWAYTPTTGKFVMNNTAAPPGSSASAPSYSSY